MSTATIDMQEQRVSDSIVIEATPEAIFDVLADPNRHSDFDGSDTVKSARSKAPTRLSMGSRFAMNMRLGVPYLISNKVVEFEENRLLTWQHFGRHRWRYELEPVEGAEPPATTVTETFDWSTSMMPAFIEKVGYPKTHAKNIAETLSRLKTLLES